MKSGFRAKLDLLDQAADNPRTLHVLPLGETQAGHRGETQPAFGLQHNRDIADRVNDPDRGAQFRPICAEATEPSFHSWTICLRMSGSIVNPALPIP